MGHSKRKRLDPSDNETSRESESDDMPKRSWNIKEIVREVKKEVKQVRKEVERVRKEAKTIKSDLKEAKKDIEFLISLFTDKLESLIPDNVKGKKVVKDDDTIQGEVREESEHSSSQSVQPVRSFGKRQKRDEVRKLQLHFAKQLPSTVYTERKLPIHLKLVDANTDHTVKSGPESSVGVEVMVLEGDSGTGGNGEKSVAIGRLWKGPLLIGNLKVNLKGGTGVLDVQFTDVSKCSRSGKFRLAVRVSQKGYEYIDEVISEPITVQTGRAEANKKSDRPQPDDEVWRLKKIKKNGPFDKKLKEKGISNVREFRQRLDRDPKELRDILGKSMTDKNWEALIKHANDCPLNGNHHQNNESDNGRQLTDHRAADKFSPKQENREDTIGKASSSFPSQVSEQQTENSAPAQHDMAPSICATPVGLDAPRVNVLSTAEGHNELALFAPQQPISANNTGGLPTQPHDANSLFAMPIQMTGSWCQMVNEHGLPFAPMSASISSFRNGHNELATLAPHQPMSTNNQNGLISLGANGSSTGELATQSHDANSQFAMPIQMTGSRRQIVNEHGLPYAPTSASISSFRNGHNEPVTLAPHQPISANNQNGLISLGDNDINTGGLPTQSHDANSQFALPIPMTGSWRQIVDEHVLPYAPTSTSISSFRNGHNELVTLAPHQPIFANNQNGLISLGDNGINTGGFPTQSHDANSQFAMPIQMTGSQRQIVNEHGLPYAPTSASISSFGNGHNELATLAPHQPMSTNNQNGLISLGANGSSTGGLATQSHDANSQFAVPIQMTGSWRQIVNEHGLPCAPTFASISSFQNGHNELAPLAPHQPISASNRNSLIFQRDNSITTVELPNQSHDANSQFAMPSHGICSSSRMDFASSENFPPSGPSGVSLSNFQNGYNSATAWPSLPQSQITCVGNRMEFLANEIACPAAVPPTSANRLDGQFSLGEDGIPTLGSSTQFPVDNSEDAVRRAMFDPWMENPQNGPISPVTNPLWPYAGYDQRFLDGGMTGMVWGPADDRFSVHLLPYSRDHPDSRAG